MRLTSSLRNNGARSFAAIQVDVDPIWAYLRSYTGAAAHDGPGDAVYGAALPHILELLQKHAMCATFFVVGRDLGQREHRRLLERALADGHEVANHSHGHPLGMSKLPDDSIRAELSHGHECIRRALGIDPRGFRAPGWDVSPALLAALIDLGYLYDSSVCPTWSGSLQNGLLKVLSRNRAPSGLGDWRVAMAPADPYFPEPRAPWRRGEQRKLVEVPVGVTASRHFQLTGTVGLALGGRWFARAISRSRRTAVVFVLHGIDLLDRSEIDSRLSVHPTTRLDLETKYGALESILQAVAAGRQCLTTLELARRTRSAEVTA